MRTYEANVRYKDGRSITIFSKDGRVINPTNDGPLAEIIAETAERSARDFAERSKHPGEYKVITTVTIK